MTETKSVQFQCFTIPSLDITVDSSRTKHDTHGNPYPHDGIHVSFRGGIFETSDAAIISHIRGLELYRKETIKESENGSAVPLRSEPVKVSTEGKGARQKAPETVVASAPIQAELTAKAVRVPKRNKKK